MPTRMIKTALGKACRCAVKDRYFWKITGRGVLRGEEAYIVECAECGARWLTNAGYCKNLINDIKKHSEE